MPKTNDAALAAFVARKVEIDAALDRIRAASDDHFFASPDDVHWADVTALADHAALLKRITDAIYAEGEHANARTHRRSTTPVTFTD